MGKVELAVLDMAGTTVRDQGEVEACFLDAAEQSGVEASRDRIVAMMGWSKRRVFEALLTAQLGADAVDLTARIDAAYAEFRRILEHHYATAPVVPADGCLECFDWLRRRGIAIALTTGFYRKVTDLILRRLGWDQGLDERRVGTRDSLIQVSVTSDEVAHGRPAPDMIRRAMELTGVADPSRVVKVGDTPSDLQAGVAAECGLTLGVTKGTHTAEQLAEHPNDGLIGSLHELPERIRAIIAKASGD